MNKDIAHPRRGKDAMVGSLAIVIGLAIGFYAYIHRPVTGLFDAAQRADSWVFKQNPYYGLVAFAGLLVLAGILRFIKAEKAASSPSGEGSSLDEIRKAKELLDSGAIDATEFEKIKKTALGK